MAADFSLGETDEDVKLDVFSPVTNRRALTTATFKNRVLSLEEWNRSKNVLCCTLLSLS